MKQGINTETGNTWGMDLSIDRCARVVDMGLASHVWMETPNADLNVARDFIKGVSNKLQYNAHGLYNHSPSFDWDVKFKEDVSPLVDVLLNLSNNTTVDKDIVCKTLNK